MKHSRGPSLAAIVLLAACGGSGDSEAPAVAASPAPAETLSVRALALEHGLDGDPANGLGPVRPVEDAEVKLGQLLFFSRTLSGRFDVACASCHHPAFAGGDALSLPVGVAARAPEVLGPLREIDTDADLAPNMDGGANVPRNSQTVINSALYDRALFHDGRVFVLDDSTPAEPEALAIRTPDSGNGADPDAGSSLLQAQARFPLVSNDEMRGYMYPELASNAAYRARLVARLRGAEDQDWLSADAADNWAARFEAAYVDTDTDGNWVSLARITSALAAYQRAMTFTNTPWRRYLAGDEAALDASSRRGARLFLLPQEEGGLGCVACHAGDHFTDQGFYNTGMPQIGRGKRADSSDHGRADVNLVLQTEANRYAFRVPGLINVQASAPYGHAGSFATLEALLLYHADPREQINFYDFDLQHLDQVRRSGVRGSVIYPNAESLTRAAQAATSFAKAEALLPRRLLDSAEVDDLVAFLSALTDPCLVTPGCLAPWVPAKAEDPDGNLLVMGEPFDGGGSGEPPPPDSYPAQIAMSFPPLESRDSFADAQACSTVPSAVPNSGASVFTRRDQALGLDGVHGFSESTWLERADGSFYSLDETMQAGGITAGYINDDCWPDILFAGGDGPDAAGLVMYLNQGQQNGFTAAPLSLPGLPEGVYGNMALADLNGDYRRELLLGNLHQAPLMVYAADAAGDYVAVAQLPMGRSTVGMAFADVTGEGYPEIYMAHWAQTGLPGSAPAFWDNTDGALLIPADARAGTTEDVVTQANNFAPGFVDMDNDADLDLTVVSDFKTTVLLENTGNGVFVDVTDRSVVTDVNGMGSALADFNNDSLIDWFVASIEIPDPVDWDGNRLYINGSSSDALLLNSDPFNDGVNEGGWGWGACAADFDNDGWQDIFQVNGYGKLPPVLAEGVLEPYREQYDFFASFFADMAPNLFINDGDGSFSDQAAAWGLTDASEGRGVVCVDYDRDGDVDVGLVDHSVGIQFYENQAAGNGNHFIALRLVGLAPNTDALGARVTVAADVDGDGQPESQVRAVSANSNFYSQNPTDVHVGLGQADTLTLSVTWPGETSASLVCEGLSADRLLVISEREEGAACPSP